MRAPRVNYQGDDTAKYIWSSKTHRSASEAFRDADYATPIWRCETEWDRTKDGLVWVLLFVGLLGGLQVYSLPQPFPSATVK